MAPLDGTGGPDWSSDKRHRLETNFLTTPFEGWTDGRGRT